MIDIIPAHPGMASMFKAQPVQMLTGQALDERGLAIAIDAGNAYAAVKGTSILAIGGIAKQEGFDKGLIWGLLSVGVLRAMTPVHRSVLRALEIAPFARIEAHILADHVAGCRWIELLGFNLETPAPMKKFWRGRDVLLYSRVKG